MQAIKVLDMHADSLSKPVYYHIKDELRYERNPLVIKICTDFSIHEDSDLFCMNCYRHHAEQAAFKQKADPSYVTPERPKPT